MGLLRTYSDGAKGLIKLLDKVELLDGSIGQVITIANMHRMEVRLDNGKIVETDPQTKVVRIIEAAVAAMEGNILLKNLLPEGIQLHTIQQDLKSGLEKLLPHVLIQGNNILASTALDKSNKPAVRIDSKLKPTAIWLTTKMEGDKVQIIIKTIVNNKENNLAQYGKKLVDMVIGTLLKYQEETPSNKYELVISDDQSGGFWKHMETLYPQISFVYI